MERQEPGRRDMGREKFLERVWEWKAESGGTIINQLKRLGASCDWSRERFTMDEGLSRAVLKVFVELYRAGADLQGQAAGQLGPEAADRDLRPRGAAGRGQGQPLALRYPLEGDRPDDASSSVATTRPETMLGDTAVAVHPDDERYAAPGRQARRSCRWSAAASRSSPTNMPIPEKGTGAVKITPAHDFNDFEVGKRHDLPLINMLDVEAQARLCTATRRSCDGRAGVRRARRDAGARTASTASPRASDRRAAGGARACSTRSSRTRTWCRTATAPASVIEPFLTDQWYVDAKTLAQPAHRRGARRARPRSCRRTGRRPISTGWRTSSPGASRASSGGATRSRPGTGRTARSSSPRPRTRRSRERSPITRTGASRRAGHDMARSDAAPILTPRRGRARHLVLLRAVAVLDARLAGRDAGARSATTRPTCWSPASTSSSSGSPG